MNVSTFGTRAFLISRNTCCPFCMATVQAVHHHYHDVHHSFLRSFYSSTLLIFYTFGSLQYSLSYVMPCPSIPFKHPSRECTDDREMCAAMVGCSSWRAFNVQVLLQDMEFPMMLKLRDRARVLRLDV